MGGVIIRVAFVGMAMTALAGCEGALDSIGGKTDGLTLTATPEAQAASQIAFVPADADDPAIREAAGVAVTKISAVQSIAQIFSAERAADDTEAYRMQFELTDQSVWEAIVGRGSLGLEVLRLERVG